MRRLLQARLPLLGALLLCAIPGRALVDRNTKGTTRAIFYEVSGGPEHPAGSKVYLLGSIHVANESVYPLPAQVEAAFKASPKLVVEADVGKDQSQGAAALMAVGLYPQGSRRTLKDDITPKCYAEVSAAAAELGLSMDRLGTMKPWMAAVMFEGMEAAQAGLNPRLGIDLHFLNAARGGKEIVELEGIEEQLALFDHLPADEQNALLYFTVKDRKKFRDDLDRLFKAWRTGDTKALQSIIEEGEKESPELKRSMDALLGRRNQKMLEKITGFLGGSADHFVVVGAAHLVGPLGLAALLKARGFTVTQH